MHIFLVVLFAILIAGAGALVVWCAWRYLDEPKYRNIMSAVTGFVTLLMVFLISVAATLPMKVNELLCLGTDEIERQIEMLAPGKTKEVLGLDELKSLLANTRQFSSFENVEGVDEGFIVRLIAANSIGDGMARLCDNIETEVALFESTGNDVTIHNILDYLVLRTDMPVRKATEILEIVISVIALVCFIVLAVLIWCIRNDYFSSANKGIVFGEESEGEPETEK